MPNLMGRGEVEVGIDKSALGKAAQSALTGLLPEFERFGKLAAVAFGIAAGAGVLVELGKMGEELRQAQETLRRETGETGKALEASWRTTEHVAEAVPVSFNDAAKAVAIAKQRLDETGPSARKLATEMAALARITGTDVADDMDQAAVVAQRWQVRLSTLPAAMNQVFRVSQQTGTSVAEINQEMIEGGQVLQAYGFNFQQSAVLIGQFEQHGINVSRVLFGMRTALAKLAKMGVDDPRKFLADLVVKMRDAKTQTQAVGEASAVFSSRTGAELATAARRGAFNIDAMAQSIQKGGDTIRGAERDTRDWSAEWELFTNRLAVTLAPVALRVFEGLGSGVGALNENMGTLTTIASGAVGKMVLITAAAYAGGKGFQIAATATRGLVTAVTGLASLGEGGLLAFLVANPWVAVGAAITAGAAATLLFAHRTDEVRDAENLARVATNQLADAIHGLRDAHLDAKQAQLSLKQDTLGLHSAFEQQRQDLLKYGKASPQYQKDLLNTQQQVLTLQQDHAALADAQDRVNQSQQRLDAEHKKQLNSLGALHKAVDDQVNQAHQVELAFAKKAGAEKLDEVQTKLSADAAVLYTSKAQQVAAQNINVLAKTKDLTAAQVTAHSRMADLALAAEDLTRKLGHVPTKHQIDVYYKNNMSLLQQQAKALEDIVNGIPTHKDIVIDIQRRGVGGVGPGSRQPEGSSGATPGRHGLVIPALSGGAVFGHPQLVRVGEDPATAPEIITPEKLMRQIVREESGGGPSEVHVYLGSREITDIVRVEVKQAGKRTATSLQGGVVWGDT